MAAAGSGRGLAFPTLHGARRASGVPRFALRGGARRAAIDRCEEPAPRHQRVSPRRSADRRRGGPAGAPLSRNSRAHAPVPCFGCSAGKAVLRPAMRGRRGSAPASGSATMFGLSGALLAAQRRALRTYDAQSFWSPKAGRRLMPRGTAVCICRPLPTHGGTGGAGRSETPRADNRYVANSIVSSATSSRAKRSSAAARWAAACGR